VTSSKDSSTRSRRCPSARAFDGSERIVGVS
jgi:hypothetical protein